MYTVSSQSQSQSVTTTINFPCVCFFPFLIMFFFLVFVFRIWMAHCKDKIDKILLDFLFFHFFPFFDIFFFDSTMYMFFIFIDAVTSVLHCFILFEIGYKQANVLFIVSWVMWFGTITISPIAHIIIEQYIFTTQGKSI